jgi:Flp pilus assembly protein protease CpaA
MIVLAGAFIFGCAALLGVVLATVVCSRFAPLPDGPIAQTDGTIVQADGTIVQTGVPQNDFFQLFPLRAILLVAGSVMLGSILIARGAPMQELGLTALVCIPLVAAWYSDAIKGIIPDWFTLAPLAIVAIYVVVSHEWFVIVNALVPFIPFALAALLSQGRGMGWGDAKFVAFGGAILGMQTAVLTFALACFAATIVAVFRDRGKSPVAFGPYLVGATAVAIAITIHG